MSEAELRRPGEIEDVEVVVAGGGVGACVGLGVGGVGLKRACVIGAGVVGVASVVFVAVIARCGLLRIGRLLVGTTRLGLGLRGGCSRRRIAAGEREGQRECDHCGGSGGDGEHGSTMITVLR